MKRIGRNKPGFTLIELMASLVILAILTTIALRSTNNLQSQTRYQASNQSMNEIGNAIVGVGNQREPDGTLMVTGFVADVGRLPQAIGTDPLTQLQELWVQSPGMATFSIRSPSSPGSSPITDGDVTIASGWRGPYLQLGIGKTELRNGWGNAFNLLKADQTTAVGNGDSIEVLRSLGSDNLLDTVIPITKDYNTDVYSGFNVTTPLPTNASSQTVTYAAPVGNRYLASISGNITFFDAASGTTKPFDHTKGDIIVCYFGADPINGIRGIAVTFSATTSPLSGDPSTLTYNLGLTFPIGPCVIRAYQGMTLPAASTALYKSPVTRLVLLPGGQSKDLILK